MLSLPNMGVTTGVGLMATPVMVRATFLGLVVLNLLLTLSYTTAGVISNDDFFTDPGRMYIRDGRWGAIPWLAVIDQAFANQQLAKPLGWIVLSVTGAALAVLIGRLFARTTTTFIGLTLITSLALMSSPNLRWGPAIWYNAVSFLWVTVALLGISVWLSAASTRSKKIVGVVLWLVGTAGATISYQPFAIIPVLAWLIAAGSRRDIGLFRARLGWAVFPPLSAVVLAGGTILLLNQVAESSRLDRIGDDGGAGAVAISSLLFAYGRPAQVALGWAMVVLAAVIVGQIIASTRTDATAYRLSSALTLTAAFLAAVALPLLLTEARLGRFAATVQIAIVIGLAAQAAFNMGDTAPETRPTRRLLVGGGLVGSLALTGVVLASAGFPVAGATLGAVLAVSSFFLLVLWAVDIPRTPAFLVGLILVAAVSVSYAMTRDQLQKNWVDIELDAAVASRIALDMSRLDLSETEVINVSYDVVGEPAWPSPLLRVYVSGPEVLTLYLDSLRNIDAEVVRVSGVCDPTTIDLVTVTAASDTEVTVCVNVSTIPGD